MKKEFEEILEAIWTADESGQPTVEAIRKRCPISVTDEDLELLARRQLIRRDEDRVLLTETGRRQGRTVVRRHRLAKALFANVLDLDAEKREAIACEVEHTLLPEVEEAICILLGHPTVCPDNNPIPPGRCCSVGQTTATSVVANLTHLAPGERGRITFIKPQNHARLHRLTAFGLTPGTVVSVHQRLPAFCIRFEGTELALDRDTAASIFVTKMD